MITHLYALSDTLNGIYDLDIETLSDEELRRYCREAMTHSCPPAERRWHAHQLRRRLLAVYEQIGCRVLGTRYSIAGLLDAIGVLATEESPL